MSDPFFAADYSIYQGTSKIAVCQDVEQAMRYLKSLPDGHYIVEGYLTRITVAVVDFVIFPICGMLRGATFSFTSIEDAIEALQLVKERDK